MHNLIFLNEAVIPSKFCSVSLVFKNGTYYNSTYILLVWSIIRYFCLTKKRCLPKSFSVNILVPATVWILAIILATASLIMQEKERNYNATYTKVEKIVFVAMPHFALIYLYTRFINHIAKCINSVLYENDIIKMRFSKIFGHVIISYNIKAMPSHKKAKRTIYICCLSIIFFAISPSLSAISPFLVNNEINSRIWLIEHILLVFGSLLNPAISIILDDMIKTFLQASPPPTSI